MKKIFTPAVLLLTVFALGACASNGNSNASSDHSKETTATETVETDSTEAQEMVFTATIVSVTELGTNEPSIQILLEEPEAVTDTEGAMVSFQNGVALNVDPATLTMDVEELAVGSKLKVTLAEPAVMTMSIPPQVPGNSIISIELIK